MSWQHLGIKNKREKAKFNLRDRPPSKKRTKETPSNAAKRLADVKTEHEKMKSRLPKNTPQSFSLLS